jgi:hypothetical protein
MPNVATAWVSRSDEPSWLSESPSEGALLMRPSLRTSLLILGVVGVGLAYPAFAQDQRKGATDATSGRPWAWTTRRAR